MKTFAINDQETVTPRDGVDRWELTVGSAPEKTLASGVLRQARADLHRFRDATDPVGREMYGDAHRWFASNDLDWPYSFRNVCDALGLTADEIRGQVFGDAASSRAAHSGRVTWATAVQLLGSVSNLFLSRRTAAVTAPRI